MSSRVLRITLSLLAGAALVAGCTDDEERASAYQRDLTGVGEVVADALAQLPQDDGAAIGPAQVRSLASKLDSAADDLDDLDPPKGTAGAQTKLERGLTGVADAFDELADDLDAAKDDDARAELFVQFASDAAIDRAFDDLAAAQDAYAAEGYRVFRERPAIAETTQTAPDA